MRAIVQNYLLKVKNMALRKTRIVGKHDQYIPHFAGLGWAELQAFWPETDSECYLVALDNRQISVLLSLLDQVAWAWWLWNVETSDIEAGRAINDFTDGLKDCLMSGCNVSDLISAVNGLTEAIGGCCEKIAGRGTQDIDDPPHDGDVPVGIDERWETHDAFFTAKCRVANAIYDTVLGAVTDIGASDIEMILSGVAGGPVAVLAGKIATAGVLGWAISKVSLAMVSLAFVLIDLIVNFNDIGDALAAQHAPLVKALFNGSDARAAKSSFMAVLAEEELPSADTLLVSTLLTNDLLNQLFNPRSDAARYVSPVAITCDTTLQIWTFPVDGQSWAFRDDSTGSNTAAGEYSSVKEAWEMTIHTTSGSTGRAKGTIWLEGLSIAVGVENSVQFDFSETSDGVNSSKHLKIIYDDLEEYETMIAGGPAAGTITLNITEPGTIETIECTLSREWMHGSTFIRDVEEVRVQ